MTTICRLATILNANVVGYSHLMGADEHGTLILGAIHRMTAGGSGYSGLITAGKEGALERLKALRREVIDPKIAEHHGRIMKTGSDGMLVEFPGPVEAVRCAVEMQQAIFECNAQTAADQRLTFRIAVSLGNIAEDGAIDISARLQTLAKPGGVCISGAVRDLIHDRVAYVFEDIGEHSVKNLAAPVRAHAMTADGVRSSRSITAGPPPASARRWASPRNAVIAASLVAMMGIWAAAWWSWLGGNPSTAPIAAIVLANPKGSQEIGTTSERATPPPSMSAQSQAQPPAPAREPLTPFSIVVLPFANLSNDPSQQYFADAITDYVISDLSQIAESFVIARDTAFAYKDRPADANQFGRQVGVRYVLEGGVGRIEDKVRIDAQLLDDETGTRLWAEQLETDRAKLHEVRNEITLRLARTFGLQLPEPGIRFDPESGADPDARDLVMRGWSWYYRPYSTATWQEAQRNFERALEIDPGSIDARIGLASVLSGKLADGWTNSRQQDPTRAEQLLAEALARDANRPAAHFAMGVLRQMQNRLPEAQGEYEIAITLDNNNARAYLHLGQTLMFLGQPEAGVPNLEKAIRLDPYDPNITTAYWALGSCYLLLGRLDEAIDVLKKARAANTRLWFPHFYLAGAFGLEGDLDEAKPALAEATKLNPAITSLARLRHQNPWLANPRQWALQDETLNVGLRRAGLPED